MQRLLDGGFTVSIMQEKIHPVGTYRLSMSLTNIANFSDTLERIANELGL